VTDKVKTLLVAIQEAEERRQRYGRQAAQLEQLYLMLIVVATAVMFLGAVVYLLYGYDHRPLFAASAVLFVVGYAAYILYVVYDVKAAEAAKQACELRCALEHEIRRPVSAGQ
jgi:Ca2+/Na+ antiporter